MVVLSPELEHMIQTKIDRGPYRDAEEVLTEALGLLEQRDGLKDLRAKLKVGFDQLERGEGIPYDAISLEDRLARAVERALAGETPNPDVCP